MREDALSHEGVLWKYKPQGNDLEKITKKKDGSRDVCVLLSYYTPTVKHR